MKKILFSIIVSTVCAAVYVAFSQSQDSKDERSPPRTPDSSISFYHARFRSSTHGRLAQVMYLGAIGEVIGRGHCDEYNRDYFNVRVTNPLWGCTNEQIVTIMEGPCKIYHFPPKLGYDYINDETTIIFENEPKPGIELYPTNQSQIIFCVYTNINDTNEIGVDYDWDYEAPYWRLYRDTRSWWYLDYEEGIPTTHFTNLVNALRPIPNWTNYYETVRSGLNLNSNRVKEDSRRDFNTLMYESSLEQLEYMNNDPLFPENQRKYLLNQINKLLQGGQPEPSKFWK